MIIQVMKGKLHHLRVTAAFPDYTGSITLDPAWMREAGLGAGERVQVLNCETGARLETYIIAGREGGGQCEINGAAALLFEVGQRAIVVAYAWIEAGTPLYALTVVFGPGNERLYVSQALHGLLADGGDPF